MGNIIYLPMAQNQTPHTVAAILGGASLPARRSMSIMELARRLALENFTQRTIITNLRALHIHSGLPTPRNPRIVCGTPCVGADVICWRSLWDRGEALAWLDGRGPSVAATTPFVDHARAALVRGQMAGRGLAMARGAA